MGEILPDHSLTNFRPSPSLVGEEIYKRLLAKYPEHFLLQDEASAIGISITFLAQLIRGEARFSDATAEHLADYLGDTPEYWINLQKKTIYRAGKKGNPKAGQEIKRRVQNSNLSTKEAAERLNISTGYLYHIFSGKVPYTKHFATNFSRVFGGKTPSQWFTLQRTL